MSIRAVVLRVGFCAGLAGGLVMLAGCSVSHGQNADGVRLYQMGQYQQAVARFEHAISSDPQNPDGYYNLAATHHRMAKLNNRPEDWKLAEDTYNLALDHDANHRDSYRGLAVLLAEQQRSEESLRLIEGWAARNPASADPKIELARLSQEFGNRDAAREQLHEALQINPYDGRALVALAQLNEQSGNTAQALANYQRAVASGQAHPEVQQRIAALRGVAQPAAQPLSQGGTRLVTVPSTTATLPGNATTVTIETPPPASPLSTPAISSPVVR